MKTRRTFTPEQKAEMVRMAKLYIEHGASVREAATQLRVKDSLLYRWGLTKTTRGPTVKVYAKTPVSTTTTTTERRTLEIIKTGTGRAVLVTVPMHKLEGVLNVIDG